MPNFSDALKALEAVEGGSELVEAVRGEVSKIRKEAGAYRTRAKVLADHIGVDPSAEELDARLKRLEDELNAEREKSTKAETNARTTKAQAVIKDALAKQKALRPDDLVELHMGRVKYREDGSPYFTDAHGAERSVEEHVQSWLKDRPELVVSSQSPGPGGAGNTKPMNPNDLSKLNPITRLEQAFGLGA
jgi:translation initiation factor 2 alpha subunit (eIF-2alpha)